MAESLGASGKDLILSTALGHELAARMGRTLSPPATGHGWTIFGAVSGAAKILKLDPAKVSHALGIAGYLCPVPTASKFFDTVPAAMAKYGSAGWVANAGVTSALLAQQGYSGDNTVFDGNFGFWRFYAPGERQPEAVTDELGKTWLLPRITYKRYPCHIMTHAPLDSFISIIEKNNLVPKEIDSVAVLGHPMSSRPLLASSKILTHVDAQCSMAYVIATAAYRIKLRDYQDFDTMRNPKILEFMHKVSTRTHPDFEDLTLKGAGIPSVVEVVARGNTFREERIPPAGSPYVRVEVTDEELEEKFRQNASRILTRDKAEAAIKCLLGLETLADVSELMKQVTL